MESNHMKDTLHYNDGLIDLREISGFYMIVMTNDHGETETVFFDDNFFTPADLLEMYKRLWRDDWNMEDEKASYTANFKAWLIETGASPEDLEQC